MTHTASPRPVEPGVAAARPVDLTQVDGSGHPTVRARRLPAVRRRSSTVRRWSSTVPWILTATAPAGRTQLVDAAPRPSTVPSILTATATDTAAERTRPPGAAPRSSTVPWTLTATTAERPPHVGAAPRALRPVGWAGRRRPARLSTPALGPTTRVVA